MKLSDHLISEIPRHEIVQESFAEYKAYPAINQSFLNSFDIQNGGCPAKAAHYLASNIAGYDAPDIEGLDTGATPEASEAMAFGSLYHQYILQPEEFAKSAHYLDSAKEEELYNEALAGKSKAKGFSKSLGTYKTWKAEVLASGGQIVSEGLERKLEAMRAALVRDPATEEALKVDSVNEVTLYFSIPLDPRDEANPKRIQCKALIDKLPKEGRDIFDLKTTRSAHPEAFARSVSQYGYDKQSAWYTRASKAHDLGERRFVFLAQEAVAPYLAARHVMPQSWVDFASAEIDTILSGVRQCLTTDDWAGYGGGELLPPSYLQDIIDSIG